jgi:hypothetical protein
MPYKGYNAVVPRLSPLTRIQELAQDQWGLVTRRQMVACGVGQTTIERLSAKGGVLERAATGIYRIVAAPAPDHLDLRAAWLQLAPETPAWNRTPDQGVVSHRSAASMYGIGDLPADSQEFTLPRRRQSRRSDVRIHVRKLALEEWVNVKGLPVTRPSRIASDLLWDDEDPESVAHLTAESIRLVFDYPGTFADQLAPHASHFGLRKQDGLGLLRWLLDLTKDESTPRWMAEARAHLERTNQLATAP